MVILGMVYYCFNHSRGSVPYMFGHILWGSSRKCHKHRPSKLTRNGTSKIWVPDMAIVRHDFVFICLEYLHEQNFRAGDFPELIPGESLGKSLSGLVGILHRAQNVSDR